MLAGKIPSNSLLSDRILTVCEFNRYRVTVSFERPKSEGIEYASQAIMYK